MRRAIIRTTALLGVWLSATPAWPQTMPGGVLSLLLQDAPVVSITSPANASAYNPLANVTVSASTSDADGTVSKVEFYVTSGPGGALSLISTDISPPFTATWVAPGTPGAYYLTARATDYDGNVTVSQAVNVNVNAAPAVSLTTPSNNSVFPPSGTIMLTAQPQDSDGTIAQVEFFQGSAPLATRTSPPYTHW